MYTRMEKQKENSSRAVANSIGQKKSKEKQDLEFMDNRLATIAQREAHSLGSNTKKAFLPTCNTAQLFKVPEGLQKLGEDVVMISGQIQTGTLLNGTGQKDVLRGSEHWGKDTYGAAKRKLDEWNLVKELVAKSGINNAANIGFGIDDTKEADCVGGDNDNPKIAGENKLVSGAFKQVNRNIDDALKQLTTEGRAKQYNGIPLIARINIDGSSEAGKTKITKKHEDNWKKKFKTAYAMGHKHGNWASPCSLELRIDRDGREIFRVLKRN